MRHGPTPLNEQDRVRSVMDVPLSEEGKAAADTLAQHVKDFQLASLMSSPLSRATESAGAIQQTTGVPVSIDEGLKPWDLGRLAGQPTKAVQPFIRDLLKHPDVKAPGGESFNQFASRVLHAVAPAIEDPKLHGVMAHGSVAQTIEGAIDNHGNALASAVLDRQPSIQPGGAALVTSEKFQPLYKEADGGHGIAS